MKNCVIRVLAVCVTCMMVSNSFGQTSGTQTFNVIVPPSISIVAPTATTITHDETDNNQNFQPQSWAVRGNGLNGVTVTFETASPFVHATDSTFKRDAKLSLAVGTTAGPAAWTVSKAIDTTAYASSDNDASVVATSNGVGRANLNLTVTFITDEFGSFAEGTYSTTVTGTVAAN